MLFIVEGSQTEFSILRRIFCNLLEYTYIEKRRNRPTYFTSPQDRFSQVAVVNTRESNIRDITENENYLDDVFDVLREQYQFPVDQSAIYYLFDRDPKSNTDGQLIEQYIFSLANPYVPPSRSTSISTALRGFKPDLAIGRRWKFVLKH